MIESGAVPQLSLRAIMSDQVSHHSFVEDIPEVPTEADLEKQIGAKEEEERIKENYRPKSLALPPVPAEQLQAQEALEDLQNELEEFLGGYIPRVASLQALVSSNVRGGPITLGMRGSQLLSRATSRIIRGSMLLGPGSPESFPDALSDRAVCNRDPAAPSRHVSVNQKKTTPLDNHMQAMQSFLSSHMENIKALQTTMSGVGGASNHGHADGRPHVRIAQPTKVVHEFSDEDDLRLAQHLHGEVNIAMTTGVFIIALCLLTYAILGGKKQMAFNVAMLFAFYSLAVQFGIMVLGGKGARYLFHQAIAVDKGKSQLDDAYFIFYLTICEQLQFLGVLFLIVAASIMAFLIFSSIAFPLLVLFISLFGALIILVSAHFKVLITSDNMSFLMKNSRRLGWRALDFVKTEVNVQRKEY